MCRRRRGSAQLDPTVGCDEQDVLDPRSVASFDVHARFDREHHPRLEGHVSPGIEMRALERGQAGEWPPWCGSSPSGTASVMRVCIRSKMSAPVAPGTSATRVSSNTSRSTSAPPRHRDGFRTKRLRCRPSIRRFGRRCLRPPDHRSRACASCDVNGAADIRGRRPRQKVADELDRTSRGDLGSRLRPR